MSQYPDFTFAHAGLNVPDMDAVRDWYIKNLNLTVARYTPDVFCFLADPTGRVVLEVYHNPQGPVLDFPRTHFLTMHLAFLAADPQAIADKLIAAGATVADPYKETPAGDRMIMLQDPFGISLQFIRRKEPMF